MYDRRMDENKRSEPGNATAYITVDKKIVGKLFIVGDRDIVTSFIDDVNDNSPHFTLFIDTLSEKRR